MNFKVVSSNIRFDNPHDAEHSWSKRKKLLSKCLSNYEAHVIGTQEGRKPQLKELESFLPENMSIVENHREWIEERMYPSLYVNTDEIFIEESGDIWLSETPNISGSFSFDSAFPRLCTWIIGAFKNSGRTFFLVNTHLDHVKENTRIEQIKVLLSECRKVNKANHPLILMGDFNTDPNSEVRKLIFEKEKNIYDPWLTSKKDEETSYHKFQGRFEDGARIDWILVDKRFETLSIELDKSCHEGIYPSDHFPVKAELTF